MPVDLAIVIVTYNSAEVINGLLDSIPAALDGVSADVVVVDNGSTDETADVVAARRDCRLVRSTNVGYAGGINRGAREAYCADAILILNPDLRLEPGSARILLTALREPGTGITAPRVLYPDGSLHYSLRREPTLARTLGLTGTRLNTFAEYINRSEEYEKPQIVDWALGAVLAISRECFDALGGWDESYFLYSEETDFCLRAGDLGFATRYEPAAVTIHIGGQSGQSVNTHVMQIVNRVRLYRRRHGAVPSSIYMLLTALREATWIRRGGRRHTAAISALMRPSRRPVELGCSEHILPR